MNICSTRFCKKRSVLYGGEIEQPEDASLHIIASTELVKYKTLPSINNYRVLYSLWIQ